MKHLTTWPLWCVYPIRHRDRQKLGVYDCVEVFLLYRQTPTQFCVNLSVYVSVSVLVSEIVRAPLKGGEMTKESENHVKEIISIEVMEISSRIFSVAGGCGPGGERSRAVDQG